MKRTLKQDPQIQAHSRPAGSLAELVRSRYGVLSSGERRVADTVLGGGAIIATLKATELAASARVSKATVSRFVGKLGLSGFDDFRHMARANHEFAAGSPLQIMAEGLATTHGDLGLLLRETYRRDQLNLSRTYADLPLQDLEAIVSLLCGAKQLVFADFRKQYALAYYATTLFRVIRPGVSSLPVLGATAVDGMLDIGPGDVVVMFPFRRPERDQNRLSQAVRDSGARLVTIGDIWPCPASERADVRIYCHTESAGVFDSFVAPISLINVLFAATAARLGESAQARLRDLETRHAQFETFDHTPQQ